MLASTIQFSKYGQEHQPRTPPTNPSHHREGKQTPLQETLHSGMVKAGPSHTTTPGPAKTPVRQVTQKNQSTNPPVHGPIPQDPTARLNPSLTRSPRSTPSSPERESAVLTSIGRVPGLMVNVPQSEAPPPKNERLGNDESTTTPSRAMAASAP